MKYMILIYGDPAVEPAHGSAEFEQMMAGYTTLNRRMQADGVLRGGDGLQGVETARSVRMRAGKVETMDGPFAETREHLGGYYIVDVPDMDTALGYAAQVPAVRFGSVEVRPLMNYAPEGN